MGVVRVGKDFNKSVFYSATGRRIYSVLDHGTGSRMRRVEREDSRRIFCGPDFAAERCIAGKRRIEESDAARQKRSQCRRIFLSRLQIACRKPIVEFLNGHGRQCAHFRRELFSVRGRRLERDQLVDRFQRLTVVAQRARERLDREGISGFEPVEMVQQQKRVAGPALNA